MNNTRWCTKEDILKDLSGLVGMGARDFNDECIVHGQKPPPPHREFFDEDEEIRLRYGSTEPFVEKIEPDLAGITQMLRLVDNFDTPENNSDNSKNKKTYLESDQVVIHKMNPNVQEFVPRSHQNRQNVKENKDSLNDTTTNLSLDKKDEHNIEIGVHNSLDKPEKNSNKTSMNKNGVQSDLPEERVKPEKIDDEKVTTEALLKSRITAASKIDTPIAKFKRNVAFTALLKLYSEPSSSTSSVTPSSSSSPKPVTLHTPDYYVGPSNTATVDKIENSIPTIAENKGYNIEEQCTQKTTEVDPSIQQSIKKVEMWLAIPKEPKMATLAEPHTGPVVFRKKGNSNNSPLPSQSSGEPTPAEPSLPAEYIPSDYASELLKKYEERSEKINEKSKTNAPVDIWTKLESDLKARDEKIRKKDGVLEVSRISTRQRINNFN